MENIWAVPEEGFAKINVHFVSVEDPLPNGNSNGVDVIIRDSNGVKRWGAMGPMHGMNEVQEVLWGAHAGMIQAHYMGFDGSQVEMTSREAFDNIRHQEFIFVHQDISLVVSQINAFHHNHFIEGVTQRQFSVVQIDMNRAAEYMAIYGMENLNSFVLAPGVFGNLQHILDLDMGVANPFPELHMGPIGEGEVVDE